MDWIPASSAEIDAAWLMEALTPRFPGVDVEAVEVERSAELTNHHALLRVTYRQSADGESRAPATMFCKLLPTRVDRRAAVAATGMGQREALFYERLASRLAMRVPDAYVARWSESDGAFVLLLEDLDTAGCSFSDGPTGVPRDAAARALEDLAELHVRFADRACREAEVAWVPPPLHDPSYGRAMLAVGLKQHRDRLTRDFADIASHYVEGPDAMHALWQHGPTTVIHGDPHIGNVFQDGGRTGFLDWGILSTGTPLRDVSYFLCMALTPEERRRSERELIAHYLEIWNAQTTYPIRFDEAWHAHRIHAAYTVLACCQIVTFPAHLDEARRRFSEAFLARAETAVTDLGSLAACMEAGA